MLSRSSAFYVFIIGVIGVTTLTVLYLRLGVVEDVSADAVGLCPVVPVVRKTFLVSEVLSQSGRHEFQFALLNKSACHSGVTLRGVSCGCTEILGLSEGESLRVGPYTDLIFQAAIGVGAKPGKGTATATFEVVTDEGGVGSVEQHFAWEVIDDFVLNPRVVDASAEGSGVVLRLTHNRMSGSPALVLGSIQFVGDGDWEVNSVAFINSRSTGRLIIDSYQVELRRVGFHGGEADAAFQLSVDHGENELLARGVIRNRHINSFNARSLTARAERTGGTTARSFFALENPSKDLVFERMDCSIENVEVSVDKVVEGYSRRLFLYRVKSTGVPSKDSGVITSHFTVAGEPVAWTIPVRFVFVQ